MAYKIKIFLADDHQIFRQGIIALFEEEDNMEVLGEVGDGSELLKSMSEVAVDVLLLDYSMPLVGGLDIITSVIETFPKVSILVFSMYSNKIYAHQMLSKGAKGYILKSCNREELISAIKTVFLGNTYISQEISQKLFIDKPQINGTKVRQEESEVTLTKREIEVLKLVAEGLTNRVIGKKLYISPRTVDTHRRNIMQKLDLHNAAELTKYVFEKDL